MNVRIKKATAPERVRAVIQLRRTALVEPSEDPPAEDDLIVDVFDALPTTEHLIALAGDAVIGGVRMTADSPAGLPADGRFDFRAKLPEGALVAASTMLTVRADEDGPDARIAQALGRTAGLWAWARGLTYVCASVSPELVPVLRETGMDPVGEPYTDGNGLVLTPLVLSLNTLGPALTDIVRRPDVQLWLAGLERGLFDEGDIITERGQPGREAYLLLDGSADVVAYGAEPGGPIVRTFGPGQVFGELALLTDRPRSATVVAAEPADVLVLSRAQFDLQLKENPDLTRALLRSIGDRFHETIVVLNETEDLNRKALTEEPVDDAPPAQDEASEDSDSST